MNNLPWEYVEKCSSEQEENEGIPKKLQEKLESLQETLESEQIKQLRSRVQELEGEIVRQKETSNENYTKAQEADEKCRAEIRWLKEALGFYADEKNWKNVIVQNHYLADPLYTNNLSKIKEDSGKIAREALGHKWKTGTEESP